MLIGPKRSGKGTIGRVMTGLLGAHNVAAPTLSSLTTNFGLSPLIGKPLAIISDARLSSRADGMIAVERLLSISGEDSLTVDRKFLNPWTGRLPTRFVILTNELPRFADASGRLRQPLRPAHADQSFYGQEDPALTAELLQEAPGIFNWALDGRDRLLERGYFLQPASGREALQHFEDLGSPVGAFIRDTCDIGPDLEIGTDLLSTTGSSGAPTRAARTPAPRPCSSRTSGRSFPPSSQPADATAKAGGASYEASHCADNNRPDPGPTRPTSNPHTRTGRAEPRTSTLHRQTTSQSTRLRSNASSHSFANRTLATVTARSRHPRSMATMTILISTRCEDSYERRRPRPNGASPLRTGPHR